MRKFKYVYILFFIMSSIMLTHCASTLLPIKATRAQLGYTTAIHKELIALPAPKEKIVTSVYKFRDQTGQYKSSAAGMTWSTAVTQGATSMLLKALEDSGWFITLEREGLPNLLNERRIISSTRENFVGPEGQPLPPLPPMLYAGVILEGGIISYETNSVTGGFGAKYFGIGGSAQIRQDQVAIYLRAVSTQTGKILKTVHTTKTILSKLVDVGIYRFVRENRLLEIESGLSTNEPPQMCVLEAIEKAVYCMIIEGILDGLWELQNAEDITSPIVQAYLKEREHTVEIAQFDSTGRLLSPRDLYDAAHITARRLGFGINAAAQQYAGDYPNPETALAGSILARYGLSRRFSLALNSGFGELGDGKNFKSTVAYAELQGVYSVLPNKKWTPFVLVGGTIFYSWGEDRYGQKIVLNDKYWGFEPALVSGIGIEYFISNHISLHSLWNHYHTFTDQLDGILHGRINDSFWSGRIGFMYYLGNQ